MAANRVRDYTEVTAIDPPARIVLYLERRNRNLVGTERLRSLLRR